MWSNPCTHFPAHFRETWDKWIWPQIQRETLLMINAKWASIENIIHLSLQCFAWIVKQFILLTFSFNFRLTGLGYRVLYTISSHFIDFEQCSSILVCTYMWYVSIVPFLQLANLFGELFPRTPQTVCVCVSIKTTTKNNLVKWNQTDEKKKMQK